MRALLRRHHISFTHAVHGLVWAFSAHPNFRVHLVLSLCAVIAGLVLGISYIEMVIIIFTILLGLTVELINTSIESMTDLITTEWRREAKIAKDVSAGMMLLVSAGAILIAAFIFLPRIAGIAVRSG